MLLHDIFKSQRKPSECLWSGEYGRSIFKATMPLHRFKLLLRLMRFDDRRTREERKSRDRFAPIRGLFEKFNKHCQENYTLSEHVTIDETLRKFRGHCKFRLYMPQKPGKYGILFRVLADAKARYVYRMLPYTGQTDEAEDAESGKPKDLVMKLIAGLEGSGRNVTMERYYISVDLVDEFCATHKLTVLGRIKSNSRRLPDEAKEAGGQEEQSSVFA